MNFAVRNGAMRKSEKGSSKPFASAFMHKKIILPARKRFLAVISYYASVAMENAKQIHPGACGWAFNGNRP